MRGSVIVGLSLLWFLGAIAQRTTVSCQPQFAWANNNLNQSPCLIASYLRAVCEQDPIDYTIEPSGAGHYGPPTEKDKCTCSMVYYNVINACSVCAGNNTLSWKPSIAGCAQDMITIAGYPEIIPSGTTVPAWAFLDITQSGNVFNATIAQDYSTKNNTMVTSSGAVQPGDPGSPSTHKSNTSAIVGGVVGGVAVTIAILSALVFWRRRSRRARGQASAEQSTTIESSEQGFLWHEPSSHDNPAGHVGRPYNPDDPTTFADALSPPTMRLTGPKIVSAISEAGTSERTVVAEL